MTPVMRPITSVAAAMQAPVLPALKKASAEPSFTSREPTTIDESRLARTARAGCSPMSITSVATTGRQRSDACGMTTSSGPTSRTTS